MAVEGEDKHGGIKTDQYRADIACKSRAGPRAEAPERIADKPVRDRDMVSDRRRDRILVDVAFMSGIRKALTYARQGVSAFENIQVKYNKFWRVLKVEEQKKYELTADEISMLIGIGASYVCDEHDLDTGRGEEIVLDIAANIAAKIERHLTGKCEFPKEDVELYKDAITSVQSLAKGELKDGR